MSSMRNGTASPARPPLYRRIACALEQEIAAGSLVVLPSAARMASQRSVSLTTMLKALRLLEHRGLVRVVQGKRTQIAHPMTAPASHESSPSPYLRLCTAITAGELRAGTPLEKVAFYAQSMGVSRSLVCESLARLGREDIIHKRGKRWFVGPGRLDALLAEAEPARARNRRPAVVMLLHSAGFWHGYLKVLYCSPFFHTLLAELERYRFDLRVALARETVPNQVFPCGMAEVRRLVDGLGNRYRGMVLASNPHDFHDWHVWLRAFARPRTPAVFFVDSADDLASVRTARLPEGAFCAGYTERDIAAFAVETLHRRGHRRAAFPLPRLPRPWVTERLQRLVESGRRMSPSLEIVVLDQSSDRFDWSGPGIGDVLHDAPIRGIIDAATENGRRSVLDMCGSLRAIVDDADVTALIAPNDLSAALYSILLPSAGIRPGAELALLSFDNRPELSIYPISTIDIGFDNLGYRLAHFLMDDLPIRPGQQRTFLARPCLADRGSLTLRTPESADC